MISWCDFVKSVKAFNDEELEFENLISNKHLDYLDGQKEALAKYAETHFNDRKLHELIRMNTDNFKKYLCYLGNYIEELKKIDSRRTERLKRALMKKKVCLKQYAFENFNIPYSEFGKIVQDYEEDNILSQVDLSKFDVKNFANNQSQMNVSLKFDEEKNKIDVEDEILSQINISHFEKDVNETKEISSNDSITKKRKSIKTASKAAVRKSKKNLF
ncbi:unnamed protein product [Brachionus calyciflorus]|uniref:Uncharacterized protein n=1 Tax=Brachionus calyciflorus TaxID=104777 RepID=A0A813LYR0_9BILA|nr:unnamed protein product [Brachionus calyciflorus]